MFVLMLAACGGPECPSGETLEALPAPFDAFEPATPNALYCDMSRGLRVWHPPEDGDYKALAETYGGTVGSMRGATEDDTPHEAYTSLSWGVALNVVAGDRIYELEVKDDSISGGTEIELTEVTERYPDDFEAVYEASRAKMGPIGTAVREAPKVGRCKDLPEKVRVSNLAQVADVISTRGKADRFSSYDLAKEIVGHDTYAFVVEDSRKDPVHNKKGSFTSGKAVGRVLLVDGDAQVLCSSAWSAENGFGVEFPANEDPQKYLEQDLSAKALDARNQAVDDLLGDRAVYK